MSTEVKSNEVVATDDYFKKIINRAIKMAGTTISRLTTQIADHESAIVQRTVYTDTILDRLNTQLDNAQNKRDEYNELLDSGSRGEFTVACAEIEKIAKLKANILKREKVTNVNYAAKYKEDFSKVNTIKVTGKHKSAIKLACKHGTLPLSALSGIVPCDEADTFNVMEGDEVVKTFKFETIKVEGKADQLLVALIK